MTPCVFTIFRDERGTPYCTLGSSFWLPAHCPAGEGRTATSPACSSAKVVQVSSGIGTIDQLVDYSVNFISNLIIVNSASQSIIHKK